MKTISIINTDSDLMSRASARRLLKDFSEEEKIVFDFNHVEMIYHSFADEIFRVWQNMHPNTKIEYVNAVDDVVRVIVMAKKN